MSSQWDYSIRLLVVKMADNNWWRVISNLMPNKVMPLLLSLYLLCYSHIQMASTRFASFVIFRNHFVSWEKVKKHKHFGLNFRQFRPFQTQISFTLGSNFVLIRSMICLLSSPLFDQTLSLTTFVYQVYQVHNRYSQSISFLLGSQIVLISFSRVPETR